MPGRWKLAFTIALMCVAAGANALPADIWRVNAACIGMPPSLWPSNVHLLVEILEGDEAFMLYARAEKAF